VANAHLAGEHVEGELLVKLVAASIKEPQSLTVQAIERSGAKVVNDFSAIGWQHIRLPQGMSVAQAIAFYEKLPGVAAAQPNFIYHAAVTPNDPGFGSLYGLNNIQAPTAWNKTTGSAAIVVAVIDTGVLYTHEDLAANMWRNPGETGLDANGHDKATNGIDDDGDGFVDDVYGIDTVNGDSDPIDDFGHGTHVAGTIGAVGNNGTGVVGVNWTVRIMAVKSHKSNGDATSASVVAAFQYVTMMRERGVNVRVTNNSWGGAPEAASFDQALKDAIDAAGNAGILNVCAAGNSNSDNDTAPFYPASYDSPSIVSVAASDQNDNQALFSSFGANSVDLAAPGVSVFSTYGSGPRDYRFLSGTSMSAPHVSGAAALLLSYNPTLSVADLKACLLGSVDVLPQWSGKVVSGGRLNVARAMQGLTPANLMDDPFSFVVEQYQDFLNREPDADGLAYWTSQITQCGADQSCVRNERVDVSDAFSFEQEFQQSGGYVFRLYRAAFGNHQPSHDPDTANPTEAAKLPSYAAFVTDSTRVPGGPSLAQEQADLANALVQRPEFVAAYPASLDGPGFVDAVLATLRNDLGVDLSPQRGGLLALFSQGGRGAVMYRLADDNPQTNPINNRAFIDAEYNRAFVATQYFGYLRRDSDINGFLFWLNQINSASLRDTTKQHAMVCSFITSAEYQNRFGPTVTHTNAECQ
jgi:subtilisin family serine protease